MGHFNVRVYGILVNEFNQVLVSDERIKGMMLTKFPGGGLEYGEGTRDCLKREFLEEMGLEVEVGEHIYTTDYYQESAFIPGSQILSIYYRVKPLGSITVRISEKPFDFDAAQLETFRRTGECESFRFIHLHQLSPDDLTLPIDKLVVRMLVVGG